MVSFEDEKVKKILEDNIETIIELVKKAYESTKKHYKSNNSEYFLYRNLYSTFLKGYCFYFTKILRSVYKDALIGVKDKDYWMMSHLLLVINEEAYDIRGKRENVNLYYLDDNQIKFVSENHLPVDAEVYNTFENYFHEYLNEYIDNFTSHII